MGISKLRCNEKGVSLLEVLVSLLIIGFGLLALAPMIVMSIEGNIISRDHSDTSRLAREKIEYYEGLDALPAMPWYLSGFARSTCSCHGWTITTSTVTSIIPHTY